MSMSLQSNTYYSGLNIWSSTKNISHFYRGNKSIIIMNITRKKLLNLLILQNDLPLNKTNQEVNLRDARDELSVDIKKS